MEWVKLLYEETKQKWIDAGSDSRGYAIFYSPVYENAKIALIGYNPGGGEESFQPENVMIPDAHEYINAGYRIAANVRKIFKAANLNLADTVKFNLIFFRTKTAKDFSNKSLMAFSEQKVLEILDRIKPQCIITEGFATFERLLLLKGGKQTEIVKHGNRAILLIGETPDKIKMFGMIHPSGAIGISHAILDAIGENINQRIDIR